MSSLGMEPAAATHVVPPTNWRFHHDEGWSSLADRHSAADHPDPVLPRLPALRTDVAPVTARGNEKDGPPGRPFLFSPSAYSAASTRGRSLPWRSRLISS